MAKKSKKGKKSKKSGKTVGYPISPTMLEELKAIENYKDWNKKFDPDKEWENTYKIWLCHGYIKGGNFVHGSLNIKKINSKSNKSFSLNIYQKIVHDGGSVHIIDAEIQCLNDALASPIEWNLSSRFISPGKKERTELGMKEQGSIKGDSVKIKSNKYFFNLKKTGGLTGDWCLFEAIQRMPFKKIGAHKFDALEGMNLLKKEHVLSYRGADPMKNKKETLQRFQRMGQGVLPFDYWLDKNHRLVIATTGPRAYILDDKADAKVDAIRALERRKFKRHLDGKGGK